MKKMFMLLLLFILLISGCSAGMEVRSPVTENSVSLYQTEYDVTSQMTSITVESSYALQTDSSVSTVSTEMIEDVLDLEIVDGPSILDASDVAYLVSDKSERVYNPEKSEPFSDEPHKQKVQEEAQQLCEAYFLVFCQSLNDNTEYDLSPLYDLSNDIRILDWEFNQIYIHGDLILNQHAGDLVSVSYEGSSFYFNWDAWDFEQDNGVLVVHTKTGLLWTREGGYQEMEGGMDFHSYTNEFAMTRVNGELKVIRYRRFIDNYAALHQRMTDRPEMAKDMREFREYMNDYLDRLFSYNG